MAGEKILVAFDGSDPSRSAVYKAIELVELGAARSALVLKVLTPYRTVGIIDETMAYTAGSPIFALSDQERADFDAEVSDLVEGHEEVVEALLELGPAQETIIEVAEKHKVSLIIMGSRGFGPLRGLLGSVSYGVLTHTNIPVLIVK